MRAIGLIGILAVCGAAATADAFVVRCQWVERVGTVDTVVPTIGGVQVLTVAAGSSHRFRLQFGVFDDGNGAAPAGGYIGWNVGTLTATGGTNSRTPGRLSPFNFAPAPPANGIPATDPWTAITGVDNTLGTQSPQWNCLPDGTIPPQPQPTIRGRNGFVSTFEITSVADTSNYSITPDGNMIVASGWGTIGTPQPPDCGDPNDPGDDVPGAVTYAPQTLAPIVGLNCPLQILVPAPGALALLGLGGMVAGRRRRA